MPRHGHPGGAEGGLAAGGPRGLRWRCQTGRHEASGAVCIHNGLAAAATSTPSAAAGTRARAPRGAALLPNTGAAAHPSATPAPRPKRVLCSTRAATCTRAHTHTHVHTHMCTHTLVHHRHSKDRASLTSSGDRGATQAMRRDPLCHPPCTGIPNAPLRRPLQPVLAKPQIWQPPRATAEHLVSPKASGTWRWAPSSRAVHPSPGTDTPGTDRHPRDRHSSPAAARGAEV